MKNKLLINENSEMKADNLLAKYFGGNATEKDQADLEAWIAAAPENEAEFLRLTKLYEMLGKSDNSTLNIDLELEKEKFEQYIAESEEQASATPVQMFSIRQKWYFAAAVFALLITITNFVFRFNSDRQVVLASGKTATDSKLMDDTKIRLSANSTLTYKADYGRETKELALKGEARFDVGKKGTGKLRIAAGNTFIEDIGTVFQVSAYPEKDYVQVKVTQGLVRFYTADNKGISLGAQESGMYDKKTHKFRILANCNLQNGVKMIQLNLDGVTLMQAIEIVSNAYNANIQLIGDDFADKKITVNFKNEKLQTVLDVIGNTLGMKIETRGEGHFLIINN